ncbi:growth inhibitor PemK [Chimaeribacter californicus]|uniref:Growth inhibitor PemK n=1 Tax=Chimaeribacter californicus TaxID=2060067 RepID=A0A2N5E508_9GAMM|nr:type II toxin-antitoxin system PemK/MazF family toxin [Chimaeribacter californicus]PLR36243.1 growth inhibitor PemK [Chimaeribacter californicus]
MATRVRTPHKGEIWHIDPDPTKGTELRGRHYFLVLSEGALNSKLGVSICCPVSTVAQAARSTGVTMAVTADSTASGTVRGVVLCHQVRALDLIARQAVYHTDAESFLVDEVVMKLIDLLDPQ